MNTKDKEPITTDVKTRSLAAERIAQIDARKAELKAELAQLNRERYALKRLVG